MKILHITTQKPNSTGSGVYMCGMIKGFEKGKHEQAVIAGIDVDDDAQKIKEEGFNCAEFYPVFYNTEELDFNVLGMSDSMPYKSTRYRDLTPEMVESLKNAFRIRIEKALKEFKPDVIICHHLYLLTSFVREIVKDVKVTSVCHGTCLRQFKTIELEREYIRKNISGLDMIFALHEEQRKDIIEIFGIDDKKVRVLGSGYNDSIFFDKGYKRDKEKIEIMFAGKICKSKGLIPFIKSLEKLDYPSDFIHVKMAGTGSDKESYEEIINEAEKSKYKIDFLGKLDQRSLAEEFNKSDIFILPSFYEGLPVVILEAMACIEYVIATDIPGVKEWIGDKINSSGKIQYVKLPGMKGAGIPKEEELEGFEERIAEAVKSTIASIVNGSDDKKADISGKTWDGLSKRTEIMLGDIVHTD